MSCCCSQAQQTEEERAQRVAAEIARRAAAEKVAAAANLTKPQLKKPSRMADTAAKGKKKQAAAEKAAAAADSPKSDLKNASRRADTVAMGQMITVGQRVNDRACWGSVPGCKVNCRQAGCGLTRGWGRAEGMGQEVWPAKAVNHAA